MSVIPKDWQRIDDSVMTNFDHSVDEAVAEHLQRETGIYAQYAGWDFCGYVWWNREEALWQCEVWVYHEPQEVVSGETLQDVMSAVSEKYGDL